MAYRYARRKGKSDRTEAPQAAVKAVSENPGMPMESVRSMLMGKAMEDRSHRIDLPDAMREKMEAAFGMNFGKVNLYESESVADAGANAIAQGGNIAFAPGKADFNTLDGRNRLGHELSHVALQARGQVTGSGYLNNSALEARADREGAMAAAGEQVYSGPVMDAPSFAGVSAPMQAQDDDYDEDVIDKLLNIRKALTAAQKLKSMQGSKNPGLKTALGKLGESKHESGIDEADYNWYYEKIRHPTQSLMKALQGKQDKDLVEAKLRFDNLMRPHLGEELGGPQRPLDTTNSLEKLSDNAKNSVANQALTGNIGIRYSNSMRHANALLDLADDFENENQNNKEYKSWDIGTHGYADDIRNMQDFAETYGDKDDVSRDVYNNLYAQDYLDYGNNQLTSLKIHEEPEEPKHHKQMYYQGQSAPPQTAEEDAYDAAMRTHYSHTDEFSKDKVRELSSTRALDKRGERKKAAEMKRQQEEERKRKERQEQEERKRKEQQKQEELERFAQEPIEDEFYGGESPEQVAVEDENQAQQEPQRLNRASNFNESPNRLPTVRNGQSLPELSQSANKKKSTVMEEPQTGGHSDEEHKKGLMALGAVSKKRKARGDNIRKVADEQRKQAEKEEQQKKDDELMKALNAIRTKGLKKQAAENKRKKKNEKLGSLGLHYMKK